MEITIEYHGTRYSAEGGAARVGVKLTVRADDVFAHQFGNDYSGATRDITIRNFGETRLRQMTAADEHIPPEISITAGPGSGRVFPVTHVDAQLMLRDWGLIV